MPAEANEKIRILELTPEQANEVELAVTKRRLAEAEERLSAIAFSNAKKQLTAGVREEAITLAKLAQAHGLEGSRVRSAKRVGRNRLQLELE